MIQGGLRQQCPVNGEILPRLLMLMPFSIESISAAPYREGRHVDGWFLTGFVIKEIFG
jgi:hypothetical protein